MLYIFINVVDIGITNFRDVFKQLMNHDNFSFKNQYIHENISSIDPGFIYNTTRYYNRDVIEIV